LRANRSKTLRRLGAVAQAPSLLVLAQPSVETDDLLETLVRRTDLCVLRVANLTAAEIALRDVAVSLVLVCPETEAASVTAILDRTQQLRPGTPVLALRLRSDEALPAWKGRTIGVLRCPILPEVLSRTVDVALGLSAQPQLAIKSKG
jgi:DNA-binding NtrC family response regulator